MKITALFIEFYSAFHHLLIINAIQAPVHALDPCDHLCHRLAGRGNRGSKRLHLRLIAEGCDRFIRFLGSDKLRL
jgi:hypothetical protein